MCDAQGAQTNTDFRFTLFGVKAFIVQGDFYNLRDEYDDVIHPSGLGRSLVSSGESYGCGTVKVRDIDHRVRCLLFVPVPDKQFCRTPVYLGHISSWKWITLPSFVSPSPHGEDEPGFMTAALRDTWQPSGT